MTGAPFSAKTITVQVGQWSLFSVVAHGWPEGAHAEDAQNIFGDYWPPLGCFVGEDVGVAEQSFIVDLSSEESLIRFESDFGLLVAEKLDGYIAVHSALLGINDAVVIVPGASHRGKSTLALAAMNAGFTVLSDEYTLIKEHAGIVRGWPRPVRRRNPDGTISRIPIPVNDGHYTPTHVMDLKLNIHSPLPMELTELSPGDVAFSLLANTVSAQSRPKQALRAVASVSRQVQGFVGTRGEATDAILELAMLLSKPAE